MGSVLVVKPEVRSQAQYGFSDAVVIFEIYLLILARTPQTFDEDIVKGSASSVHADGDAVGLQDAGKALGCKLGTLVRVAERRGGHRPRNRDLEGRIAGSAVADRRFRDHSFN